MGQKQLREKFNPDGSNLRRHQLKMIELLDFVDDLCQKYNILYWLDSGTLLGAVRHHGFIPWDDDLDIQMMKKDYNKFLDVLKKEQIPDNIAIQTQATDKYYTLPFLKIRDKYSIINETHGGTYKYNGIFIDVFPLEKNNITLLRLSYYIHYPIYKLTFNNKNRGLLYRLFISIYLTFENIIIFPFFRFISKVLKTKYLTHTFTLGFYKKRYIQDIFPLGKIDFEGKKYPCPANTDSYLKKIYGDYKSIPNLDNIVVHSVEVKFL